MGHFQEFEDEYLETLFDFHEKCPGERVRNGALAKYLSVSPASTTEMIQRLATNGYVEYVPYKGALLTEKGLERGQMIKRRHRLTEVLLELLPFDGDVHETACRLEHAFDDDLEVCISILLGNPKFDPSGKAIPPPRDIIAEKISQRSDIKSAFNLKEGESGEIILILSTSSDQQVLNTLGITSGSIISNSNGLQFNNFNIDMSDEMSKRIIVRS
ncbi:MAG: metal-dependent transcriptional regulator [Candidatus Poseidoniaceae archaeon]|jgi:DtxR family Mn-dependent transcriptional regulator|nr:metal-dependent transcriptional regulator [Candidatus Poseidoniaceae archaeon]